jgi:hypothetical protein
MENFHGSQAKAVTNTTHKSNGASAMPHAPFERQGACRKLAMPLAGMAAIVGQIQKIVCQINAGSAQTKEQKRQCRPSEHVEIRQVVRRQKRNEQEQVLQPLMCATS